MSLPAPLVTVSRFLLSNLSSGLLHHPCLRRSLLPVGSLPTCSCSLAVMARRTLGLCCSGGCHPSQHHVHDCSLALGLSHSISPGGFFTPRVLPLSHHLLKPFSPVTSLILLRLPSFPAHSLLSPLPVRLGPLLPLCHPQLPLLQGILTFLLLWLQDPLLSTLLHHPLSPRLQFLSWIPASLRNLSLAHLG